MSEQATTGPATTTGLIGRPEKSKRARKTKAGKAAEPTAYVVLECVERPTSEDAPSPEAWTVVGELTARGGNEGTLLRKWGEAKQRTGTFKLVPARSWQGGIRLFEQTSMASEPIA